MPAQGSYPAVGLANNTDLLLALRNGQTVNVTLGAAASQGIATINSADYATVAAAVTQAQNDALPVLLNNGETTSTTNLTGTYVVPGSRLTSNIGVDNPTISITGSNTTIIGANISAPNFTGIQFNTNNANDVIFNSIYLNAPTGYGILDNDALSDGWILSNSIVYSGADSVECNHPTNPGANRVIIGNILSCIGPVEDGAAGFTVGIAQVNSFIVMGNALRNARQAAFHIEDLNTRGVIVGNTASNCLKEGITIQVPVPGKGFPDPVVGGFNNFKHTGDGTHSGIVCIGDSNGNVDQFVQIGNCINNFATGIINNDGQHGFYGASLILNCDTAVFNVKHGDFFGPISTKNTPILLQAQSGSICDPIYSLTTATSILIKSGGNLPGPLLLGWGHPVSFTHTGSGAENFAIAPMPSLFYGDIIIRIEGNGAAVGWVGTIKWDGSSLTTVTTKLTILNTPITVFSISTGSGNLQMTITSGTGFTQTVSAIFDGYWMQNS